MRVIQRVKVIDISSPVQLICDMRINVLNYIHMRTRMYIFVLAFDCIITDIIYFEFEKTSVDDCACLKKIIVALL